MLDLPCRELMIATLAYLTNREFRCALTSMATSYLDLFVTPWVAKSVTLAKLRTPMVESAGFEVRRISAPQVDW